MKDSPCHYCTKHSSICHAHCREYQAWAAELAEKRRAGKTATDADVHTAAVIERNLRRGRHKRRRGQR